jgi:hypothetical protein
MKHAVVLLDDSDPASHKRVTLANIGRRLARLKQCAFVDTVRSHEWALSDCYFLPAETLSRDQSPGDWIDWTIGDLFGGVVMHRFMSTKLITHPLLRPDAPSPCGWCHDFPAEVRDIVLPGFSVFASADLMDAAAQLLSMGPVRVKAGYADGGSGQCVLPSAKDVEEFCETVSPATLHEGYVIEQNLANTRTHSIGQVRVDDIELSYIGEQRTVVRNSNDEVYAGTTLYAVRGGWNQLSSRLTDPAFKQILLIARHYDECAQRTLKLVASRKNYDVVTGTDVLGRCKTAVLEQSWRAGGATNAEILALEAFKNEPALIAVRAASYEIFGQADIDDKSVFICFHGEDPVEGPMTKYARLEAKYYA